MKQKILLVMAIVAMMVGSTGCDNHDLIEHFSEELIITVTNTSHPDKNLRAYSFSPLAPIGVGSGNIINDDTDREHKKRNKLPVEEGDVIEIKFIPKRAEETKAILTMPDGSTLILTSDSSTSFWTVPDDFTPNMTIYGESHYSIDHVKFNDFGTIVLISMEDHQ